MVNQQVTWIGSAVDGCKIEALLGEGAFASVYAGTTEDGSARKAFKVARPNGQKPEEPATGCYATCALQQQTGTIGAIEPDNEALLELQARRLQAVKTAGMVSVENLVTEPGLCYYRMPLLDGETLRAALRRAPLSIDLAIDLARTLDKLSQDAGFGYHGDIKPENVIVSGQSVTLLDPGYFGRLPDVFGTEPQCAITTPQYYPLLQADDLFAVGVLLWEAATGQNPFGKRLHSQSIDKEHVHPDLLLLVRSVEATGNSYLSAILTIKPHAQEASDLEKLLFKALRLRTAGDQMAPDEGFRSFSAMAGALIGLKLKGVKTLSLA